MEYAIHLAVLITLYLILAQGFNLVFGLGLLFNLAHVSTYAIGAYVTALLSVDMGASVWITLPASMFAGALFSILIGAISTRLSSDYFAIATIAFSSVVTAVLINWRDVTRGVLGIAGIPRPVIGNTSLDDNMSFLGFSAVVCFIVMVAMRLLFSSPLARALRAQGQFDRAAQSIGINTPRIRLIAFAIASGTSGIAGSLFAYYLNYIDPSSFMLHEMILVLTICIVGMPGSFGGVCGAVVGLTLLPEALRFVEMPSSILGPMRQLLYALILCLVVYFKRGTIFPRKRVI